MSSHDGPTLADLGRGLTAADPSTDAWTRAALVYVTRLHEGDLEESVVPRHGELRDDGIRVAGTLLDGRELPPEDRAAVADFRAHALVERFREQGLYADLEAALQVRRTEAAHRDSPWACEAQINLAAALLVSWDHTERQDHLEAAGAALRAARDLARTPEQRAAVHGGLGNVHSSLYDLHRRPADLGAAVEAFGAAADSPDPGLAHQAQASLASSLLERFHSPSGDAQDLAEAERFVRSSLAADPASLHRRHVLARILRDRHEHDGDGPSLEEAWRLIARILDEVPRGAPGRGEYVATASAVSFTRHLVHHDRTVLTEALDLVEEALRHPETGPQGRAVLANQACLLLTERFTLDGTRADIDRAVELALGSLRGTQLRRDIELVLRTNCAGALHRRYETYGTRRDLMQGINLVRWVTGHASHAYEKAAALHTLALLLGDKAQLSQDPAHFDDALARTEEALALTPGSSAERAATLVNQAGLLADRARAAGEPAPVDRLIEILEEARAASSGNSAVGARAAHLLGCHLAERSGLHAPAAPAPTGRTLTEREAADLVRATEAWQEAIALEEPFLSIEAGQRIGNAACALERWEAAVIGYGAALDAADELAARRTRDADRELARFQVQGVAAAAAYAAVRAEAAGDAVVCLEQGAATLLARSLGRSPERPGVDDVLTAARTLGGPLVYWAATLAGGIAVVVHPGGTATAHLLDGLTTTEVDARLAALEAAFGEQDGADVLGTWSAAVRELLDWVWETAVAPVADEIDGSAVTGLVPVGRLASLPLAAAAPEGGRPLLARTVPRLLPGSAAVRAAPPWPGSPLVVLACDPGQGTTALPYAEAETDEVAGCYARVRRFGTRRASPRAPAAGAGRVLRTPGATTGSPAAARPGEAQRWIEALSGADVAHVVCHYDLDADRPLRSVLRLGGGIEVGELLEHRLPDAPHLVLSACDTALSGVRLPDEVIGLGTVLLACGARSVVASLWPLDDELAKMFMGRYHRLLSAGVEPARALAAAQRAAAVDQPSVVWPALVHMG
ncbi:CHAT domain-containing protein [Streptomyces sp. NPDC093094]|uniref:CHAT domain-containing protein n=1 Tax=Streptomyces sp. NPDC093094 TaxID=3366026 RepID=UPI0038223BC4